MSEIPLHVLTRSLLLTTYYLLSVVIMNMVYLVTETRVKVGERGINDPSVKIIVTLFTYAGLLLLLDQKPLVARYLLLTAYCLLLTTYYLLLPRPYLPQPKGLRRPVQGPDEGAAGDRDRAELRRGAGEDTRLGPPAAGK